VDGGPTRDAVRQAAAGNRAALARRPAPGRRQVQAMVVAAARRLGVDPALAQAVAHQESGFQQKVVSPANAIGAMQVVPSSGRWASRLVGRPLDLFDARDNVVAGVAILAVLTRDHPEPTAIAAYYQGLGSVHRHGMYSDTRRYVADVQTLRARFREAPQGRP
jgi:soluble lytic murein transglycosylase-like protein